jgi:hypothetical protein
LKAFLQDRRAWLDHLGQVDPAEISAATANAAQLAERLEADPMLASTLLARGSIGAGQLRLSIDREQLRMTLGLDVAEITPAQQVVRVLDVPLTFRKRGRQLKLAMNATRGSVASQVDTTLVTAVARAFDWFDRLASGRARSIDEIAASDGFDAAYVSHLIPLAHMAPAEIDGILSGLQSPDLTADFLVRNDHVNLRW